MVAGKAYYAPNPTGGVVVSPLAVPTEAAATSAPGHGAAAVAAPEAGVAAPEAEVAAPEAAAVQLLRRQQ